MYRCTLCTVCECFPGFNSEWDTWEPADNLTECQELVDKFVATVKSKSSKSQTSPKNSPKKNDVVQSTVKKKSISPSGSPKKQAQEAKTVAGGKMTPKSSPKKGDGKSTESVKKVKLADKENYKLFLHALKEGKDVSPKGEKTKSSPKRAASKDSPGKENEVKKKKSKDTMKIEIKKLGHEGYVSQKEKKKDKFDEKKNSQKLVKQIKLKRVRDGKGITKLSVNPLRVKFKPSKIQKASKKPSPNAVKKVKVVKKKSESDEVFTLDSIIDMVAFNKGKYGEQKGKRKVRKRGKITKRQKVTKRECNKREKVTKRKCNKREKVINRKC